MGEAVHKMLCLLHLPFSCKKWYYRFYVEDASGNLVQKECAGTHAHKGKRKQLFVGMNQIPLQQVNIQVVHQKVGIRLKYKLAISS
ncbi:MAG: hypothetical protein K2J91_06830 [Lachnospiraceae bacterium]|nr:hypothetical protein [Lachnospiraceae bacterium]